CFDATRLAERLRELLPSGAVHLTPPPGAHHVIRVHDEGEHLLLELLARDPAGHSVAAEQPTIPPPSCPTPLPPPPPTTPPVPHPHPHPPTTNPLAQKEKYAQW